MNEIRRVEYSQYKTYCSSTSVVYLIRKEWNSGPDIRYNVQADIHIYEQEMKGKCSFAIYYSIISCIVESCFKIFMLNNL